MASNVNKVTLLGRLGSDPELKYTQDGNAIARLSIATSEKFKDRSGEQQEKTEWHRCAAFGKAAEIIGEYCKKGDMIYVEGKIAYSKRTGDDGIERYFTDIKIRDFTLLGGKREEGAARPGAQRPSTPKPAGFEDLPFEDDIPF